MKPPQFSLRDLFIQTAIVSAYLALSWLEFAHRISIPYLIPAALAGVAGAFIGGLFRQYMLGALIGFGSYLAVMFAMTIDFPSLPSLPGFRANSLVSVSPR